MKVGEMLIQEGLISQAQLEAALEAQKGAPGKKLGEILMEQGAIDVENFTRIVERQMRDAGMEKG